MSAATDHLLGPQRRRIVLTRLKTHGTVQVNELAEQMGISHSTVRRDLREMEQEGLLQRVHGGATALGGQIEPDQVSRWAENHEQKQRIGAAAAARVKDGSTILISGGTTTESMVAHLAGRRDLTVITNSLVIASALASHPEISVVVLGGLLRHRERSLLGHLTEQALGEFQIDQVYTSAFGIGLEAGVTGAHIREARTDRAILDAGRELLLLADATKLRRRGPIRLVSVQRLAALITDAAEQDPELRALAGAGVPVIAC